MAKGNRNRRNPPRRRRIFDWAGWANNAVQGVRAGVDAYRGYQDYAQRRVRGGTGVTTQHDSKVIYRRKRAPRKKRRRAKKAMRSFKSKMLKLKGHRQMMCNNVLTVTSGASSQSVKSFVIYGGRIDNVAGVAPSDAVYRGYDDMNDMRRRDYMLGDSTGDAQNRFAPGDVKWYVKTAVMDCTIQNIDATIGIEMDVYEFTVGKFQYNPADARAYDVESQIQNYNQDTYLPGASNAGLTILTQTMRGATPFEFGPALSKMKMKILKKTKYFIPPGNTITYQLRDTKCRTMTHAVFRDNVPTTYATRGIYIVSKPVIHSAGYESSYKIGFTRKYKYVVDSSATDRTAWWDPGQGNA